MPTASKTSLPRAILFDMDGTLTEPFLDFPQIRAEMGIGPGPILESLAELHDSRRREAKEILHRHEKLAAENSRLNDGCADLLSWLSTAGLPIALVTRNSHQSVRTFFSRHNLSMDVVITREDGPFKPSPLPLQLACQRLNVNAPDAWMVGDGEHDIAAAHAAGIKSIWISHGKPKSFPQEPWLTVTNLPELKTILQQSRMV